MSAGEIMNLCYAESGLALSQALAYKDRDLMNEAKGWAVHARLMFFFHLDGMAL